MSKQISAKNVQNVLTKSSVERSPADNDLLVKTLLQFIFSKQLKLKEKDVREIIPAMKYAQHRAGENITQFGNQSNTFYIIVDGNCSVWAPLMHSSIKPVIQDYLKHLDEIASESANFYRHYDDEGRQDLIKWFQKHYITDQSRTEMVKPSEWREMQKSQARAVLGQALKLLPINQEVTEQISPELQYELIQSQNRLEMCDSDSKTFWSESQKLFAENEDKHKLPRHFFEYNRNHYEFCDGFYYIKISDLKIGEAFGQGNKIDGKLSETIRAESVTELATLNMNYYQKCIKKIEQKRLNKTVDFFMKLQYFSSHSKNFVTKFTLNIRKVKYKRNQRVYSEGQGANNVYIVWKGEFEMETKLQKKEDQNDGKIQTMLGQQKKEPLKNVLAKKLPEIQDLPNVHRLTIYGPGCLLGEEDIMQESKSKIYRCSLRCYSAKGVLYEIAKEDFLKLLTQEMSMNAVKNNVNHKNIHKEGQDLPVFVLPQISQQKTKPIFIQLDDISILDPEGYLRKQKRKLQALRSLEHPVEQDSSPRLEQTSVAYAERLIQTVGSLESLANQRIYSNSQITQPSLQSLSPSVAQSTVSIIPTLREQNKSSQFQIAPLSHNNSQLTDQQTNQNLPTLSQRVAFGKIDRWSNKESQQQLQMRQVERQSKVRDSLQSEHDPYIRGQKIGKAGAPSPKLMSQFGSIIRRMQFTAESELQTYKQDSKD